MFCIPVQLPIVKFMSYTVASGTFLAYRLFLSVDDFFVPSHGLVRSELGKLSTFPSVSIYVFLPEGVPPRYFGGPKGPDS